MGAWYGRETSETEVRKMLLHSRERFAQLEFEDTLMFRRTSTFNVTYWSVPLKEAAIPICLALHRHANNLSHLPSTSGAWTGEKAWEPFAIQQGMIFSETSASQLRFCWLLWFCLIIVSTESQSKREDEMKTPKQFSTILALEGCRWDVSVRLLQNHFFRVFWKCASKCKLCQYLCITHVSVYVCDTCLG